MTVIAASCPLCGNNQSSVLEAAPSAKIWSHLSKEWGARFSEEVLQKHSPAGEYQLRRCKCCGLDYFDPAIAGDADFYAQLTSSAPSYYSQEKWDFREAARLIGGGDSVLDIACGGGSFLAIARERGANVVGIDTNPAAVESASRKGLPAECASLGDFAARNHERFDVVTAFQVIEHLDQVLPFVKSARDCLKPGGKLIITVPNRLRRFRAQFEPLDWPPHHLTHWSAEQLITLAKLIEFPDPLIQYEPADMYDCRIALREKVAGKACAESFWARALGRMIFSAPGYAVFASTGLIDHWQLWRMSLMAVLTKPATHTARD